MHIRFANVNGALLLYFLHGILAKWVNLFLHSAVGKHLDGAPACGNVRRAIAQITLRYRKGVQHRGILATLAQSGQRDFHLNSVVCRQTCRFVIPLEKWRRLASAGITGTTTLVGVEHTRTSRRPRCLHALDTRTDQGQPKSGPDGSAALGTAGGYNGNSSQGLPRLGASPLLHRSRTQLDPKRIPAGQVLANHVGAFLPQFAGVRSNRVRVERINGPLLPGEDVSTLRVPCAATGTAEQTVVCVGGPGG
mmetsp:Transcript_24275/g.53647  ORF Transcript_24275/g.53647 Transcript_24275/m.53647 type:complete len:250 (-) Transcript_24275:160-909(-)